MKKVKALRTCRSFGIKKGRTYDVVTHQQNFEHETDVLIKTASDRKWVPLTGLIEPYLEVTS